MKNIVYLIILLVLSLSIYQCSKSSEINSNSNKINFNEYVQQLKQENSISLDGIIPHYNNTECEPANFGCVIIPDFEISVKPVCSLIPANIIGDCEVKANYDLCADETAGVPYISFYNFALGIPSDGDCSNLSNYLESLNEFDRNSVINCIADYVKYEGINQVMAEWARGIICGQGTQMATADFYEAMCSKKCRIGFDTKDPGDPREFDTGGYSARGGGSGGWWYYFVSCGSGCCITSTEYCYDLEDSFIISTPTQTSTGDCISGSPSQWEISYCFDEVEPCQQRCGN